jgi:antirestriction protein ArdC
LRKIDAAATVTALILDKLRQGTAPWVRPWSTTGMRPRRYNGLAYSGINTLYLWAIADARGYTSPYWMTARQARQSGAAVRGGEPYAISVYHATARAKPRTLRQAEEGERFFRFLRCYAVYNADQIEGLPAHYHPEPATALADPVEHRAGIAAFFEPVPVPVRHGGARAYYSPASDHIQLPHPRHFGSLDHYWSTRAHECVHATGAAHRLNRVFGKRFGDKAYAFEELVACLGQSFISAELGLPAALHDSHASYLASWIDVLERDKTAIIQAAAKAERAVAWLSRFSSDGDSDADGARPPRDAVQAEKGRGVAAIAPEGVGRGELR